MRNYLEHLIIGVAIVTVTFGVLFGIVQEMTTAYDGASRYAYIWGIVFCALLIAAAIYFILLAATMNKRIFRFLTVDERRQFFKELNESSTLHFGDRLIITQHFVVAYAHSWRAHIHILRLDDLVACFGRNVYGSSSEPDSYHLILFDKRFKMIKCVVNGKKAQIMDKGYQALLKLAPWVFSDNYDEFMDVFERKSREKAYLKEIELRRSQTDDTDDTLPEEVITAADIIRKFEAQKREKVKFSGDFQDSGADAQDHSE